MYPSFDSIIETLNAGKTYSFPGGVHPDDKKALSNTSVIQKPSMPELLVVPLRQHIGSDGICCVDVGDTVLKGQVLSQSSSPFSVPVHAPTSGEVVAIAPHVVAHPSGLTEMCVSIRPDGKDTWCELSPTTNYSNVDKSQLIDAICQAGISGMGGAGFPTHIKTSTSKPVEFLILNGIECEPYITSDDRLMREHAWQIRQGLDILAHLIGPKAIIVAVEDNKPEAFEALNIACQDKKDYRVVSVETKYPAGGEKQLIQVITGREVPRNGLPADIGVMMFNVGTCYAIADAILHGKPLIERIVTVTGEAVESPSNFRALIGTPVSHLLSEAKYNPKKQKVPKVVMGGPMMGFTLSDATIPVVKTTNCLLVPAKKELVDDNAERPCIRCSACADACPASLLPQQMFWHAKAKEYDKAEEYDLFDCIECGACAYVCPSEIPLVHYYRQAKAEIRLQRDEKNKAEKAKQRFEARKERLEREKREREEKHRKAKEARLAANKAKEQNAEAVDNASNTDVTEAKDKVAAALARAKAKKAALQAKSSNESATSNTGEPSTATDDKKAQVAAAIARAKAKKAAQAQTEKVDESSSIQPAAPSAEDEKKAKVAAAIARAKAKKAAQAAPSEDPTPGNHSDEHADKHADEEVAKKVEESTDENNVELSAEEQKKARIAAAVAKAKAQKAAKSMSENGLPESSSLAQPSSQTIAQSGEQKNEQQDEKRARIAAAVAKAKAKKAEAEVAQTVSSAGNEKENEETVHLSENNSTQHESNADSSGKSEADEKKARIAAAVAKAKAKKLAQASQEESSPTEINDTESQAKGEQSESASQDNAETSTQDGAQMSGQDEKKARIAAAIAKAKAKKAAADKENESQ